MCRISQNSNLANANHCSNYQAEKKMNVKGEKKRSNNAIIPKSQVCKMRATTSQNMLVFVLAAFCWTKSLLCNVAAFIGMLFYSESTLQL